MSSVAGSGGERTTSSTAGPLLAIEDRTRDLARGWGLVAVWGPPVVLLLLGSFLGGSGRWSLSEAGVLIAAGTGWLGAACLANAIRCGRLHCLIAGPLFLVLAGVEALAAASVFSVSWSSLTGGFWAILIASFVAEGILGPYASRPRRLGTGR